MDFFYDIMQNARIYDAETKAEHAKDSARRVQLDMETLERRIDGLTLACQALWELLRKQGQSDEVLLAKIQEIDLRDGKLDGKNTSNPGLAICAACGRQTSARRRLCLYCGKQLTTEKAFEQY